VKNIGGFKMAKPIKLPDARSLNRRERRAMKEAGADPQFRADDVTAFQGNEALVEYLSKEIYHIDGPEYDEIDNAEFVALADKTYRLTFGMPVDIKNS
jgi:hypothetical protein